MAQQTVEAGDCVMEIETLTFAETLIFAGFLFAIAVISLVVAHWMEKDSK